MKTRQRDVPPALTGRTRSRPADAAGELVSPWRAPERLAFLVAFACILLSVSFRLYEYDVWQHLTFGKAIWTLHEVPRVQLWTWLDHGTRVDNPSWGFSALLWPFWAAGGELGLALWRWLTTLAVFGLLWKTGRALGVRGLPALIVFVLCALVYRQRSQVRPETLAAVLLALELWLLATRRGPGRRDAGLVLAAWAWANVHISWYLGLVVLALHALAPRLQREPAAHARAAGLGRIVLAAFAVSFVNPFGWRTVWRPFEFALHWRNDPLLSGISELRPLDWSANLSNGLPLLMLGWPLLLLWRWRRVGPDWTELGTALIATTLALTGTRFVAPYALLAAPWCARDFDLWWRTRARPRATYRPWRTALVTSALCVLLPLHEWRHFENTLGVGFDERRFPVAACDFMETHGIRGRGINDFYLGGYLLWRFWPDPSRLPFFDIHPEDKSAAERLAYLRAFTSASGWRALDARHRFDYALLSRSYLRNYGLLDLLDMNPDWALVFVDDVAALYVRRDGALAAVAGANGYRVLPGGRMRLEQLALACTQDRGIAEEVAHELEQQAISSRWSSTFAPLRQVCATAGVGALAPGVSTAGAR